MSPSLRPFVLFSLICKYIPLQLLLGHFKWRESTFLYRWSKYQANCIWPPGRQNGFFTTFFFGKIPVILSRDYVSLSAFILKAIATGTKRAKIFHLYFIEVKLDESHLFPARKKRVTACNLWLHYVGVVPLWAEKNYNNILWKRTDLNNDETHASSPHTFSVKWNLDPFSHEKRKRKAVSHKERLHTRKTYGNCHQHYQARLCRVDLPWVASVTKCQSEGLSLHLRSPASMVFMSVFWGEMNKEYNSFIQVSSLSVSYFRVFYKTTLALSTRL